MQYADEHYTGCYISTQEESSEPESVNVFIYATYTAVHTTYNNPLILQSPNYQLTQGSLRSIISNCLCV